MKQIFELEKTKQNQTLHTITTKATAAPIRQMQPELNNQNSKSVHENQRQFQCIHMRRRKTRENIEKRVYEHTDEKIEKNQKKEIVRAHFARKTQNCVLKVISTAKAILSK